MDAVRTPGTVDGTPLARAVAHASELAAQMGERALARWCRLELQGYWDSNPELTDDTVVPTYRTVVGQHRDVFGRTLLLEPSLGFLNETRLRCGIEELEALAGTRNTAVVHDPGMCDFIREHLGTEVYYFCFSATAITGVLSSIREELRSRLRSLGPIPVDPDTSRGPPREMVQLRPNLHGIGIDLRELWRRIRQR